MRHGARSAIRAERIETATGRRPATVAENRTCGTSGCHTRLSRYNTAKRCYVHQEPRFRRFRGQRRIPRTG